MPHGIRTAQTNARSAAAAAASPNSNISADVARYFAAIRDADAYIAGSLFAHVAEPATPFTKQFKRTARYRVPQNKEIYDEADRLQGKCTRRYFALRVTTAALFGVFLWLVIGLCDVYGPHFIGRLGQSVLGSLLYIGAALLIGAGLALVRYGARWAFLDLYIKMPVGELAHLMSAKFNKVVSDTNIACGQIESRTDFGTGLGWAQRAWGWSMIALWNSIQSRTLDGYATTVFWKMQFFDIAAERTWRLIKGVLLIVALFALFYMQGSEAQRIWIKGLVPVYCAVGVWLVSWYFMFVHWKRRIRRKLPVDFLGLALAYAVLAAFWTWKGASISIDLTVSLIGAVCIVVFWSGWIVADERDDKELVQIFTSKLKIDDVATLNTSFYFNSISARFQNLVEELIDAQRSTRGTPPATTKDE